MHEISANERISINTSRRRFDAFGMVLLSIVVGLAIARISYGMTLRSIAYEEIPLADMSFEAIIDGKLWYEISRYEPSIEGLTPRRLLRQVDLKSGIVIDKSFDISAGQISAMIRTRDRITIIGDPIFATDVSSTFDVVQPLRKDSPVACSRPAFDEPGEHRPRGAPGRGRRYAVASA